MRNLVSLVFALALTTIGTWVKANTLDFALIGDVPYNEGEALQVSRVLAEIPLRKSAHTPRFVIHLGDIKSGVEVCSDQLLSQRLALLDSSPLPLSLVLGDNEWLDCHRRSAGSFRPQERLNALRSMAFARDESLGKEKFAQSSQRSAGFPENRRWTQDLAGKTIVFVSVNIPGSLNGHDGSDTPEAIEKRMQANGEWLGQAFQLAREKKAASIVMLSHANPMFSLFPGNPADTRRRSSYASWLQLVAKLSREFSGQVLYLHGDSHLFKHDQPLEDAQGKLANFTRIECYGSPFSTIWLSISINPIASSPSEMFKVLSHPLYQRTTDN